MLLSQVKAGKRGARHCAFNFPAAEPWTASRKCSGILIGRRSGKRHAMNQRSEEQQNRKCFYALAVRTQNDDIPAAADNSAHFYRHSSSIEKRNALKRFDFPLLRVPLNID
jgi:hypothetical protein